MSAGDLHFALKSSQNGGGLASVFFAFLDENVPTKEHLRTIF